MTDLSMVCQIMKQCELSTSDRCCGHIHIGAKYLDTKEAFGNFLTLWLANEESIYRIALSEVNEILKYTDDDIVSRIPKKFITFISNNMDTNHKFKVQENVELFEQPIRNETKTILAMIYRDYFCDDVERQELIDYDKMQKDIEKKN